MQLPLPSQVPSNPQVETGLCGQVSAELGGTPAATNEQTPGAAGVLHDLQLSVQAVLQQTPSTQNPVAQSAAHPQAALVFLWLDLGWSPPVERSVQRSSKSDDPGVCRDM